MKNFLGLSAGESKLADAKWVILPAPYERTTTYVKGCRRGPMAIINASQQVELYDERLGGESYLNSGIYTAPSARCVGLPAGAALKNVQSEVRGYLKQGKRVALLGGEHTVSLAAVRAHRETAAKLTVLCLDAHADLRDKYQGSPLNHACVSRRLLETGPLVVAGVRNISVAGARLVAQRKLPVFFAHLGRLDSAVVSRKILAAIKTSQVYLSLDLDVLDPSLMNAVGTPEPGGAGYDELARFLGMLCRRKKLVGFDMVELCPKREQVVSDFTAAKLAYHLIGLAG